MTIPRQLASLIAASCMLAAPASAYGNCGRVTFSNTSSHAIDVSWTAIETCRQYHGQIKRKERRGEWTCAMKTLQPGEAVKFGIPWDQLPQIFVGLESSDPGTQPYLEAHWAARYIYDFRHRHFAKAKTGKEAYGPLPYCPLKAHLSYTDADYEEDLRKAKSAANKN